MKPVRLFVCWILAALSAAMVSSNDLREEVWLNPDGSGRARIEAEMSSAVAGLQGGEAEIRRQIEEMLATQAGFRAPVIEITNGNRKVRVVTRFAFESASDLLVDSTAQGASAKPSRIEHMIGEIEAAQSGWTLRIRRKMNHGKAFPGASMLPTARLDGYNLTTILHLPSRPVSSNANRVENNGQTLIWEQPLSHALRNPAEQQVSIQNAFPWVPVSGIAAAIAITCGFFIFRPTREKR